MIAAALAPLRNDQILADSFAERGRQARPVAVLPTLTYGFYPAFLEYPGDVARRSKERPPWPSS